MTEPTAVQTMSRLVLCLVLLASASAGFADTNAVDGVEVESIAALKAENESLRKENQRLRRELVRQKTGEPAIDLAKAKQPKQVEGAAENGKAENDGGFWLSEKSGKRHNSTCRYYKMGKGRPCRADEGEPCKKCEGK